MYGNIKRFFNVCKVLKILLSQRESYAFLESLQCNMKSLHGCLYPCLPCFHLTMFNNKNKNYVIIKYNNITLKYTKDNVAMQINVRVIFVANVNILTKSYLCPSLVFSKRSLRRGTALLYT